MISSNENNNTQPKNDDNQQNQELSIENKKELVINNPANELKNKKVLVKTVLIILSVIMIVVFYKTKPAREFKKIQQIIASEDYKLAEKKLNKFIKKREGNKHIEEAKMMLVDAKLMRQFKDVVSDITMTQGKGVLKDLNSIGIENVKYLHIYEPMTYTKNPKQHAVFSITPLGYHDDVLVDTYDYKTKTIKYNKTILFNRDNGGALKQCKECLLTEDEYVNFMVSSEELIKRCLKSPSTSKFPWNNDWKIYKENNDDVFVKSYVDAQNGFGATVRDNFIIKFSYNNSKPKLIVINDKIVFNNE